VIDYIDAACKSRERRTQWIRADAGEGFTGRCTLP
jgi:hypothetical protein